MRECDYSLTSYHGSQQKLTELRAGSSITQNRDLAKAFSHRPSIVSRSYPDESLSDDCNVKHNGVTPGYLYTVSRGDRSRRISIRIPTRRMPMAGSG